jgi:hypothetical protein
VYLTEDEICKEYGQLFYRPGVVLAQALAHPLQLDRVFDLQGRTALSNSLQSYCQITALVRIGGSADYGQLQEVASHDEVARGAADSERGFLTYTAGSVRAELAAQALLAVDALGLLGLEPFKYGAHALLKDGLVDLMALCVLVFLTVNLQVFCHDISPG